MNDMRVLICGSREWTDAKAIRLTIEKLPLGSIIVHGACPTGADAIADELARAYGFHVKPYPADWTKYGNAAGPIRNRRMLVEGKPDLVIAFDLGGDGTRNMIEQAKQAGVRVAIVKGKP